MSTSFDFDRSLTAWLDAEASGRAPDRLVAGALDRTARIRPRPAWTFVERWLPMELTIQRVRINQRLVYAVVVLGLGLLLALAAAFAIGQQPSLPAPLGPARNGMILDDSNAQISIITRDGVVPAGLTTLTPNDEIDLAPIFSPDGTRIAYFSSPKPIGPLPSDGVPGLAGQLYSNEPASVYVSNAERPDRVALGAQLGTIGNHNLSWSHDSTRLAVAYTDANGQDWIDVFDVATAAKLVHHVGGRTPVWSPDDTLVAYQMTGSGVFLMTADGTGDRQLTQVAGSGLAFAHPSFSLDGHTIAFYAGPDGNHAIWLIGLDGSNETPIPRLSTPGEAYWPAFSPDGTQLEFNQVVDSDNNIQFAVASADGSNARLLPSDPLWPNGPDPWSPDGRYLMGLEGSGTTASALVLVDTTGAESQRALPSTALSGFMTWQRLAP